MKKTFNPPRKGNFISIHLIPVLLCGFLAGGLPSLHAQFDPTELQNILASDAAASDQFGWSVSISGDGSTAIVGAIGDDDSGSAYFFGEAPPPPATVPTLGEWGLIILALLLLTLGTVAIRSRQIVLTGVNTNTTYRFTFRQLPFKKALFIKILLPLALGVLAVFTIAMAYFGYKLTNADIPGSIIATPILAYWIHLMMKEVR